MMCWGIQESKIQGHFDFILWEILAIFLCIGIEPSKGFPSKGKQQQEVNIMYGENPHNHIKVRNIRQNVFQC